MQGGRRGGPFCDQKHWLWDSKVGGGGGTGFVFLPHGPPEISLHDVDRSIASNFIIFFRQLSLLSSLFSSLPG